MASMTIKDIRKSAAKVTAARGTPHPCGSDANGIHLFRKFGIALRFVLKLRPGKLVPPIWALARRLIMYNNVKKVFRIYE